MRKMPILGTTLLMTETVSLISLGCAKNLVNSEQMAHRLWDAGFRVEIVPDADDASGIAVVNTCGFIDSAKEEAIDQLLRLGAMKADGRISKIVCAGCLPERYKNEIAGELPEIDALVGVGGFGDIVSAVVGESNAIFPPPEHNDDNLPRILSTPPSWAYLKIADGCDNRCAFCAIPDIRGHFRSRAEEDILSEARWLVSQGVREIIVIAQDITRYGLDLYGERRLARLIRSLSEIPELLWLRLHYLYPDSFTQELIAEIADNSKVLKYLDIPIQHINDGILRKMNRRGTGAEIRTLFSELRKRIPGLVLRTSLITGLPGEGNDEFEELLQFLQEAKIERAGVFAYSPEEGTPAALLERPDSEVAAYRAEQIQQLQSRIMDAFNDSRIGKTEIVLFEGLLDGRLYGRSFAESPDIDGVVFIEESGLEELTAGEFYEVQITGADCGDVVGSLRGIAKIGGET